MHEEDAFWCLVFIIEHLMPVDYYSRDKQLIGAQVDQVIFVSNFLCIQMNKTLKKLIFNYDIFCIFTGSFKGIDQRKIT